jgi:hypothetical protein
LRDRRRIRRRRFLQRVLEDVESGACSALEHAYLTRVERAHHLPAALRQVRDSNRGPIYRDVVYEVLATVVELDGRLDHSALWDRDADLERDLDATLDGLGTVRLGWGQVIGRPCSTAEKLGRLFARKGWLGTLSECPHCQRGDSQSSGDWESPRSA